VGLILGASFRNLLQLSVAHSNLCSESTWQNILKSVIATVASTSQFVGSLGIDDVAGRLQGLIDGVIDNSNTNHLQLEQAESNQPSYLKNANETLNESGSGNK
jgi:hypothetical protein